MSYRPSQLAGYGRIHPGGGERVNVQVRINLEIQISHSLTSQINAVKMWNQVARPLYFPGGPVVGVWNQVWDQVEESLS